MHRRATAPGNSYYRHAAGTSGRPPFVRGRRICGYSSCVKEAAQFLTLGKTAARSTCCIAGMTTYHDELKWRRRRYLRDSMLCRWGSLRHCDFALSYPHLGIAERWDLLRHRERVERWYPFRDRSGDVNLRPPPPDYPRSFSDQSLGRRARLLPYALAAGVGALLGAGTWIAFPGLVGF